MFSLDPIEGYRPPTLAGHRDALVGVFFAHPRAATAAAAAGTAPAHLFTASRDGALFCWAFKRSADAPTPGLPSQPADGLGSRAVADADGGVAAGAAVAADGALDRDGGAAARDDAAGGGGGGTKRRRANSDAAAVPAFAGAYGYAGPLSYTSL